MGSRSEELHGILQWRLDEYKQVATRLRHQRILFGAVLLELALLLGVGIWFILSALQLE